MAKNARSPKVKPERKPDVEIQVCETDPSKVHAQETWVVRWKNSLAVPCQMNFNINGCPFTQNPFTVLAASGGSPGYYDATVKTGSGHNKTYYYNSPCCKGKPGQPIIIID